MNDIDRHIETLKQCKIIPVRSGGLRWLVAVFAGPVRRLLTHLRAAAAMWLHC